MPRLFLGNLGHDCRERDIEKLFKGYGDLKHVNIKGPYGFVELDDKRDAEDAIKDLNGKTFNGGSRIRIEYAQGNDRGGDRRGGWDRRDNRDRDTRGRQVSDGKFKRTNYRLVVENMSSRTSWQDLKDFMRKAGDITYTTVNRGNRGEGLVEFSDREGMEYALKELDDTKLDGNRIRLSEEGGRKNSRSRSRSRSDRRGNRRRSRSKSMDRRSPEARKRRSPTPDEKSRSRSRSNDRSRTDDRNRNMDRKSEEKRQRSRTPDERSRSRSDDRARNSNRGSQEKKARQMSRTPDEKSRSRSRSNDRARNEENKRYDSRSPRSGDERD
eukprot:TRINITY_DN1541_c0_g1_i5.p1 TRINITY_DN1541_c0_g1~~TRINITY_DN1541_c0_g1_i5.p1  ORF type:complete len:326 (-),score=91.82 TRINITY_DN1541_c0_g1_i5:110-1087(-)